MSTKTVAFIGVFAAFHATLYLISPAILWRNWAIYLSPIEGMVLGPWAGLIAALIGSTIGRVVLPSPLWMFGIIAEPLSVMTAGFLTRDKWQPVIAIYAVMLAAYFISPLGQSLPLWPMLDTIAAVCLVYPAGKLSKNLFSENVKLLPVSLVIVSFTTIAMDGLTRVFLLIPARLYSVLGWSPAYTAAVFVGGGVDSFIEDALVVLITLIVGVPILLALRNVLNIKKPLS
ncbi:MAG: hypothetical protein WCD81_07665 [Candidatus Bathyarchaeia archaeon]